MPTRLTRPVCRTTQVIVERRRQLVVTLHPRGTIGVHASRLRIEYELPLDAIYELAVRAPWRGARQKAAQGDGRAEGSGRLKLWS